MTPKQTAITRVAFFFGSMALAGVVFANLLNFFTLQQMGMGFAVATLVFMIKMVYDYELDRAERLEKLNKMVD